MSQINKDVPTNLEYEVLPRGGNALLYSSIISKNSLISSNSFKGYLLSGR